ERTADPDLAIGGFADPFDVTDVDRRAVQTARHDVGDVEGAIADPSEGMGPGLTGLGLRPEVLERQSAAAPPGGVGAAGVGGEELDEVGLDLVGWRLPPAVLRVFGFFGEIGLEAPVVQRATVG